MIPFIKQPLLDLPQITDLISKGVELPIDLRSFETNQPQAGHCMTQVKGSGMAFDDLRVFQHGDDQKQIDWRASARSQHTLTRQFLKEQQRSVFFVVDRGASMRFGSKARLKVTQAVRLSLWLSGIFLKFDYTIGAASLSPNPQLYPSKTGHEWVLTLAKALSKKAPQIESDPLDWPLILTQLLSDVSPGATLFLISDFHSLNPSCAPLLSALAQRFKVHAIHVSDPLERHPQPLLGTELTWHTNSLALTDQAEIDALKARHCAHVDQLKTLMNSCSISFAEQCASLDSFTLSQMNAFYDA